MNVFKRLLLPLLCLAQIRIRGRLGRGVHTDGVIVSKMDLKVQSSMPSRARPSWTPQPRASCMFCYNDHRIEWVDRLYEAVELEKNGQFDYVLYQAFDLPLTFADRDYVYRGQAKRVSDTVVELHLKSVEHPAKPTEDTVGVRAELVNSLYRLTDLEGGKTRVEVEIQTDPKGWMPVWLVNLVQKDWPLETLNGMRGELSKDYCGDYPLPTMEGAAEATSSDAGCVCSEGEDGTCDDEEAAKCEEAAAPEANEDGAAPA